MKGSCENLRRPLDLSRAYCGDARCGHRRLLLPERLLSEPCGARDQAGLGAVGDLELREDGRDVVAGVAGSESAVKPLRITGRVLRAGELPGFVPKERPAAVTSVAAWNKVAPSGGIDVEARLRRAGFVAAVREDLEWTKGSDRAALSAVVRLGSAGAARAEIAQQVRDFAAAPNRGRVKTYTPFAVPGIPGAHGLTLTDDRGGEGHNIIFADGPFTYLIGVGWGAQAKDPPTRAQLISTATTLYKRVHARPAP